MKKIFIITTVPITLKAILKDQPKYLSSYFNVHLLSTPGSDLASVGAEEGVSTIGINLERGISPVKDLLSIIKMILILLKYKPDMVHSYTPKAGLVSMVASFICRVPVRIHTFTGLIFPTSKGINRKILKFIDKLICFCSTTVIPEGNGVKYDLINNEITKKPLNIIGNGNIAGVDLEYFSILNKKIDGKIIRSMFSIPKESFVFCYVGRFTPDKGFYELYDAFLKMPNNCHLLLVGNQDKRVPLAKEFMAKVNLHSRIHQTGYLDDIRNALICSDVLVLPSYREGFPNTPLQAGSMSLPSIVSNVSGSNEIITEGFNGWVAEPRSVESLYSKLNAAMLSNKLDIIGANARQNVVAKFDRENYLALLVEFYNEKMMG